MLVMFTLMKTSVFMCALATVGCNVAGGSMNVGGGSRNVAGESTDAVAGSARGASAIAVATGVKYVESPRSADSFVDSVGIDTHFSYTNTPYAGSYSSVRSYLAGLHVRHLRDGLIDTNSQPYYDHLNDLATIGIHADLITQVGESMSVVTGYPARVGHAMESIEGPNEYDLSGDANWAANLRAFQQKLYATVKKSATTSMYPVLGPSLTSYEACMAIGNLSAVADAGNMHDYFSFRNPGTPGWGSTFGSYGEYGSLTYNINIVRHVFDPRAITATETGWDDGATYGSTANSVTPAVKARYTMRVLLEHWNAGVTRTYLYELLDEGGQNYGLLDGKAAPKPVYTAVANLLAKLNDPGTPIKPTALTYTLTADPSVHHTLLQKRDGSYRLLLWVEAPATSAVPKQTVTLALPSTFHTIEQYEWEDNGNFTTTSRAQAANNTLVLQVSDRVTDLKLQR